MLAEFELSAPPHEVWDHFLTGGAAATTRALQVLLLPAYAAAVALAAFVTVYLAAHYGAAVSERCQGRTCRLWQHAPRWV